MRRAVGRLALLICFSSALALPATLSPGKNIVTLRGEAQSVWYFEAAGPKRGTVLYTPGDGGWRGFAVDMAKTMSTWGYDVFAWDTKQYLSGFTGQRTLTEAEIASDFLTMRNALIATDGRMLLVGWSQGAGMSVLAAANNAAKQAFGGVVAIGLPETAVLGWRWADNLTYVTKREPDEPKFRTEPYLQQLAPLPLGVVQASDDEYTSYAKLSAMFSKAADPKVLHVIDGSRHNFAGREAQFFSKLKETLEWVRQSAR